LENIWLILFIVFLIAEVVTMGAMVSIWFCLGALAAMIMEHFGLSMVWQTVGFVGVSLIALFLFKWLTKKAGKKTHLSNFSATRIIDKEGLVIQKIDNLAGTGQIKVEGKGDVWTARSVDGQIIEADDVVRIVRLDGVKAIVERRVNSQ